MLYILCSFTLVLEGKTDKEIPEISRLEFLEKFSANSFALLDAENNTWTMAAEAAENHGDKWGLSWSYNDRYIHQFQPGPTHKIC